MWCEGVADRPTSDPKPCDSRWCVQACAASSVAQAHDARSKSCASRSGNTGLTRKSSNPACSAASRAAPSENPVSATKRFNLPQEVARKMRAVSYPSISGRSISINAISHDFVPLHANASRALATQSDRYPSEPSSSLNMVRESSSSSTISTQSPASSSVPNFSTQAHIRISFAPCNAKSLPRSLEPTSLDRNRGVRVAVAKDMLRDTADKQLRTECAPSKTRVQVHVAVKVHVSPRPRGTSALAHELPRF